eukprot:CAMPEP_0116960808 /NCGR_PEP_ID=MMETSP0467-20121206/46176_1 /TAXON_ID=283647 /ORGANISM="Mesodinium pulex, Strain SPMC105" /LENGTH=94 /DNA_ID=CAMNT_0004648597 /DNA_START=679 /DNA_END=963 /DNA_ORIENTATION=-
MKDADLEQHWTSTIGLKLASTLRPFQKLTMNKAIRRGGRLLIGDEMGCGKTIQAISLAMYYSGEGSTLIICPSSLKYNWKAEFLKFTDLEKYRI